ncbi:MAG: autotransporter domain-containing protein [Brevundimonas sp.]|nr:MAG: autotransporter domain-containing protein [Brevundimonas sp.]
MHFHQAAPLAGSARSTRASKLNHSVSAIAVASVLGLAGLANGVVAPGIALASDECGDPNANGGAGDLFVCPAGIYPLIEYTDTNGNLALILEDAVKVGGISIVGDAGELLTIQTTDTAAGLGDLSTINPFGAAIDVFGQGPGVQINLTSTDVGADAATLVSGLGGINAVNTSGFVFVRMTEGSVVGTNFAGVNAQAAGAVSVQMLGGTTVSGQTAGVTATSTSSDVDVTTTGLVVSSAGVGVALNAVGDVTASIGDVEAAAGVGLQATAGGDATVEVTGDIFGDTAVRVQALAGDVNFSLLDGASVESTNAAFFGVGLLASGGGNVFGVIDGNVANGGLSAVASSGGVALTGSGDIVNTLGSRAVDVVTDSGDVFVGLDGDIIGKNYGVRVTTGSGDAIAALAGNVSGAGSGVRMESTSGDLLVDVGATAEVSGGAFGVLMETGGDARVIVAGSVTGTSGVRAEAGGAGGVGIDVLAGGSVESSGNGLQSEGVLAIASGTGDVDLRIDGQVLGGGVLGYASGSGDVSILGAATGVVTNGLIIRAGIGALATTGDVVVDYAGSASGVDEAIRAGTVSGAIGIRTGGSLAGDIGIGAHSSSGDITILSGGTIDAVSEGIFTFTTGETTISNDATIRVQGTGISANSAGGGGIAVFGGGDIAGSATFGVLARGEGDILIDYTGDVGSEDDRTSLGGVSALIEGGLSGSISMNVRGDIFTDGGGVNSGGVTGGSFSQDGAVDVAFQGRLVSGGYGVLGVIADAANTSDVTTTAGDGSSITGALLGVAALNQGAGAAVVTVGEAVAVYSADTGVQASSTNDDAHVVIGDGARITLANTNSDGLARGIAAFSGRAADTAPGQAAVDVRIGNDAEIFVDTGNDGDADGGSAIRAQATGADGGVAVRARSLRADVTGNNATGIAALTNGGDILVSVEGGQIDLRASNSVDTVGNFGLTAGIMAGSATGDIVIDSGASIGVANAGLPSAAIFATTGGDGAISITQRAYLTSGDLGIVALSSGAGAISVDVGADALIITDNAAVATSSAAGAAIVTAGAGSTVVGNDATGAFVVDMGNLAGGSNTFIVEDGALIRSFDSVSSGFDDNVVRLTGGDAVLANAGRINGVVNFAGSGSSTFDNTGQGENGWHTAGLSNFSDGDDQLQNSGTVTVGADGAGTTFNFAAGTDAFFNSGALVIGEGLAGSSVLTLAGLETLTNAGTIKLMDGAANDLVRTNADTIFTAGSVLSVDIAGASAADLIDTSGTLAIEAGARLTVNAAQPFVLYSKHVVAEADGGVTGEFDFADQFVTAFAGLRDGYTATTAFVEFAQLRDLADAGITPNQKETAGGADSLPDGNPLKDALLLLPDDAAAIDAFDQLSGEIHPSVRTAVMEASRMPREAVLDRLSDDVGGGSAWAKAYASSGLNDGDTNAARMDRDLTGFVVGADRSLGENLTIGFAAGTSKTDVEIDRRNSAGSVETVEGLAYVGARFGDWRVRGGVGYAETSVETRREIAFPGFAASPTADYDGTLLQGFVEAGYRFAASGGHVEPFANLTAIQVRTDAFAEQGGGAAGLTGDEAREDLLVTTLGLRFETNAMGAFSLGGSTGWRHTSGDVDPAGRHAFAGGAPFTVLGAAQSDDAAFARVEARWKLSPSMSIGLAYDGTLGTGGEDHAITGGFKVVF